MAWRHGHGRPRRGGSVAIVPAGGLQTLRRCVDTVSSLPPTCSVKACRDRRRTRYGPVYGGAKGGAVASRRTNTISASMRAAGREVGRGVSLCKTGLGALRADERSRSRKDCRGGSPVARNSPGRTGWLPITASAGDGPPSRGVAERMPNITQGRCWSQSAFASRARRASFRRRWNLSTRPLDCG
jgi:hypothetical protein